MPIIVKTPRRGFTLVELMVIVALLAFLMGLFYMAVSRVRDAASRVSCQNNLRQLALATHNMNDAYRSLPPIAGVFPAKAQSYGTLFYYMLPFIEQDNIYKMSKNYVWNERTYSYIIKTYQCPQDVTVSAHNLYKEYLATSSYAGNWLVFGKGGASIPASFPDGTSNTIVFTERYQMCKGNPCAWGYPGIYYWSPMFANYSEGKFQVTPAQAKCDPALPQSNHAQTIPVAMGDGSVRMVANTISTQTWWHACTPNGGETLGSDWSD